MGSSIRSLLACGGGLLLVVSVIVVIDSVCAFVSESPELRICSSATEPSFSWLTYWIWRNRLVPKGGTLST